MCFGIGKRGKEKQFQSTAKPLYEPSSQTRVVNLSDYDLSLKSRSTRHSRRSMAAAAGPRGSVAGINFGRDSRRPSAVPSQRASVLEESRKLQQEKLKATVTTKFKGQSEPQYFYPGLKRYIEKGQLLAILHQESLAEAGDELGEHRFDVDMAAGALTFVADDGRKLECRAHLIASVAPGPQSVLWGWAHPYGDELARKIRKRGERDDVPELLTEELPFPDGVDLDEDHVAQLAHEIGAAAVGITGLGPYYSAPNGSARVVFLLDAPLPPISLAMAIPRIPRLLASGVIHNQRKAVEGLCKLLNWSAHPTIAGDGIDISDCHSTAIIKFDKAGKLQGLDGKLGDSTPSLQSSQSASST